MLAHRFGAGLRVGAIDCLRYACTVSLRAPSEAGGPVFRCSDLMLAVAACKASGQGVVHSELRGALGVQKEGLAGLSARIHAPES